MLAGHSPASFSPTKSPAKATEPLKSGKCHPNSNSVKSETMHGPPGRKRHSAKSETVRGPQAADHRKSSELAEVAREREQEGTMNDKEKEKIHSEVAQKERGQEKLVLRVMAEKKN